MKFFPVFMFFCLTCFSKEPVYENDFLSTPGGLQQALRDKYGPGIIEVYLHYDKRLGKGIFVYVDQARTKCLVSFGGRDLELRYEHDGIQAKDLSAVFSHESVLMRMENTKIIDRVGVESDGAKAIVGQWFSKPEKGVIRLSLSSSDGEFVIEWNADDEEPTINTLQGKQEK